MITGGKDISNAVSSANATITADAVHVGTTGLIYTEYKNSDKTALELGNNISTQGEDLLIQNGEGESEGTLLSQQDGVTSQRNVTTQSKSLAEAAVGTAALVNQGAEFIAGDGLNSAVAAVARASGNNSAFGAVQAGVDFDLKLTDLMTFNTGLGYMGVWNGDADSDLENISLSSTSIEGNTGFAKVGLRIAPQGSGFSCDLGATGYAGDRKGGSASVMLNYAF